MYYQPYPDSKVHGTNAGPTWVLSAPGGPHIGPMNLAIMVYQIHMLGSRGQCNDSVRKSNFLHAVHPKSYAHGSCFVLKM